MSDGEAFSRVKIDAQLSEASWDLTDGRSVRYEYVLAEQRPDSAHLEHEPLDDVTTRPRLRIELLNP